MAEQDRERRKHWTGRERGRLRQYQEEWEVGSKVPEDEREDAANRPRGPLDATNRTDEK
jgi:hypothetical protein